MRSLDRCQSCELGTMKVYVTRRFDRHVVRYKRCSKCRETSKHVTMISLNPSESSTDFFIDAMNERIIQQVEITNQQITRSEK